jgi:HlyD family secretion protein
MTKKQIRFLLPALAVLSVAAVLGARFFFKPVEVVALRQDNNLAVQVYGLGTLEVHTISRVGFKVSGTLVKLNADHGDRVSKGEILALLDSAEQESRVAKASANVEKAKAAVLVAKAGKERARATLKFKEKVDQRRDGLARTGFISKEDAEEKRAAVEVAGAELKLTEGEVASALAALKDALAQLEFEKVLLSQHALLAPYDAQVMARHKELGSVQVANEPLFTLIDPNTVWAKVHVDEALAGSLQVGQPAEVRLRSAPGRTFGGQVKRIDIESDRVSEERRVYVSFDNLVEDLHLGEQAEAVITVANIEKGFAISGAEIQELNGTTGLIWAVADGRLDTHRVSLGQRLLDGRYQVLDELPRGCTPVASVPAGARKGAKAVIIERER